MTSKFLSKKLRSTKRWSRKHSSRLAVAVLFIGALGYATYIDNKRHSVDPTTYRPLLDLIARAESNGNYNAYFGNANNSKINFTAMPIAEVMQWQAEYVEKGSPSNAVGKYQIISPTLAGLVEELEIDTSETFDESTQDKLAMKLLERRGAKSYVNQELSDKEFAANLAKEWAALPKTIGDNPDNSYYAGDGLNKSRVEVKEVLKAIEPISAQR